MSATPEIVVFHNALTVEDDGWAMLAPWGEFPGIANVASPDGSVRRERALQRWDRASGSEILNGFETLASGVQRFAVGLPIFDGHPDSPTIGHRYERKGAVGSIAEIQIRDRGLFGRPVFNNDGAEILRRGDKVGFSTRAEAVQAGSSQGVPVFHPVRLLSVGLTTRPNLPVEMLNECEQAGDHTTMNKEKLITWLKGQGVELANDAGDDQIMQGLDQLGARIKGLPALEQENARLKTSAGELTNERDTLKGQVATLEKERDSARTEFANEREGHIAHLTDLGVRGGHITEADRGKWKTRLANAAEFTNAADELLKSKILKTEPATTGDRNKKAEIANEGEPRGMARCVKSIDAQIKK